MPSTQNWRWRRPPFWISPPYHCYAVDGRIIIKFGTPVHKDTL